MTRARAFLQHPIGKPRFGLLGLLGRGRRRLDVGRYGRWLRRGRDLEKLDVENEHAGGHSRLRRGIAVGEFARDPEAALLSHGH
jgi:hypothetical protein